MKIMLDVLFIMKYILDRISMRVFTQYYLDGTPCLALSRSHTNSRLLSHWPPHARYLALTHLRALSRLIALPVCSTLTLTAMQEERETHSGEGRSVVRNTEIAK